MMAWLVVSAVWVMVGLGMYVIACRAFLGHTMIWKGRCRISFGGWIADSVVSLSARVG